MSDGPWKSLPMRPHWKQVAKQAERDAFTPAELAETLEAALWKEAEELPLASVRRAVVPEAQGVLFRPDLTAELEAVRRDHPGSKVVQTLLTCVGDAEGSDAPAHEVLESAVVDTLDECARDHSRAIAEHFFRKSSSKIPIHERLESARRRCKLQALAAETLAMSDSFAAFARPAKRSGLDEGPLL